MQMDVYSFTTIYARAVELAEAMPTSASLVYREGLVYRTYGKYDVTAVVRQGRKLLVQLDTFQPIPEQVVFAKWQGEYRTWQKKVHLLKNTALLHGALTEQGSITLYKDALAYECELCGYDLTAYSKSVLIHECCHYLQREAMGKEQWFGTGANIDAMRTVKETLAEFLRYYWCLEHGQRKMAEDIAASLVGSKVYYPGWPYAGAQVLIALHHKDAATAEALFERMWHLSIHDWYGAYRALEEAEEKNIV
ncbi:hypothetical protein [Phascolarctobacterium sp.]|uniref:hypothetical protein n=1 Tax=Phascolarctobacterium sp. TaxID=2049039 RepID=UPI00386BBAAE